MKKIPFQTPASPLDVCVPLFDTPHRTTPGRCRESGETFVSLFISGLLPLVYFSFFIYPGAHRLPVLSIYSLQLEGSREDLRTIAMWQPSPGVTSMYVTSNIMSSFIPFPSDH